MKNITLSADEDLIERARLIAQAHRRTLNAAFREWLMHFTGSEGDAQNYRELMKNMRHIKAGGHFTRDELNER
jgi:predicted transcriptional regulator